jgi:hypothetical protein
MWGVVTGDILWASDLPMTAVFEPQVTEQGRRLPDFFIAGAMKCGTTALYEMLRQHPQLHMPMKEPYFFAPELVPRVPVAESLDAYLDLFEGAAPSQLIGEATPCYIRSVGAPGNMASLNPHARVIVIFREPVALIRSAHNMHVRHGHDVRSLRRALKLECDRRVGRSLTRTARKDGSNPKPLLYSDLVRFTDQVEGLLAHFPPENVLILIYDDLVADNQKVLGQIQSFLGVDAMPLEPVVANEASRRPVLSQAMHRAEVGQGAAFKVLHCGIKLVAPRRARRRALDVMARRLASAPRRTDAAFQAELMARFRPEVAKLSQFLGRDLLTEWGYDT